MTYCLALSRGNKLCLAATPQLINTNCTYRINHVYLICEVSYQAAGTEEREETVWAYSSYKNTAFNPNVFVPFMWIKQISNNSYC